MPADALPAPRAALEWDRSRRKGLRIALAVSAGLVWSVASGQIIPFLGPLFAAQFLIGSSRPLPLAKVLGMVVLVVVVGWVLQVVTVLVGDRPPVFLLVIGLVYFACFHVQASGRGGPAVFMMLVIAVMVPLLTILHRDLGASILAILLQGVIGGAVLMWLAHALVPDQGGADTAALAPIVHPRPLRRALADTAILLLILVVCLTSDRLSTALVIPITVVSLLAQLDASASGRAALGIALVNLIGGVAASVAYVALQISPSLLSMFLLVLLAGLVFGGRAALALPVAKLHAGALTIFLIIFGTGVSPLPGTAAESFATRVGYIALAIAYTIMMTALLWPRSARPPSADRSASAPIEPAASTPAAMQQAA